MPKLTKREFVRQLGGLTVLSGAAATPSLLAQTRTGKRDDRIARTTATTVSIPCEYQGGSVRHATRMTGVVMEIETADGLVGHGFTSITNDQVVVAAARDVIAPYLKGKDAMAREAISEDLFWRLTPRGQTGHAVHAISLVDGALWDIAGKRYGEPVWKLLGGARDRVGTYTTCGMNFLSRDELAQVARDLVKSGQKRLKMVVAAGVPEAQGNANAIEKILAEDVERVRIFREAAGNSAQIMIDANQALDLLTARRFTRQLAPYDLTFFEEPLRANDVLRLADLRREAPMPIAAGQNEGHLSRWRDMLQHESVDLLQFNVCIGGGFTAGLKIAGLAQAFGTPIENAGGYSHFNMHLHAGVANGGLCEWHLNAVAYCNILYKGLPDLTNGDELVLPQAPGLGFELNRDALKQFAV